MLYCPVCSRRLAERKCKLFCEQCGYYMSCATIMIIPMSDLANILERFRRGGELLAMSTTGAGPARTRL